MKLEVRCCCDVMKLMGWIPVPYQVHELPPTIRLPLLATMSVGAIPPVTTRHGVIDLFVGRFAYGSGRRTLGAERALKADGIPIETLRLIQGFIEATPKNIATEIKLKRIVLYRDGKVASEIRVHPSIMAELSLIPYGESPLKVDPIKGCTFDGLPLIPDVGVMSFSVVPERAYAAGSLKGTTTGCR